MPGLYSFHVYLLNFPQETHNLGLSLSPEKNLKTACLFSSVPNLPLHPSNLTLILRISKFSSPSKPSLSHLLQEAFLVSLEKNNINLVEQDNGIRNALLVPEHVIQALGSEMRALVLYILCLCTSYTCFHILILLGQKLP